MVQKCGDLGIGFNLPLLKYIPKTLHKYVHNNIDYCVSSTVCF